MNQIDVAVAVLKKNATKENPIHAKEIHYLAEHMFSSEDYHPKRVANLSPEKSIQSQVGQMAIDETHNIKRIKKKEKNQNERYYYYLEKPFGDALVKLEDGTIVRALVIEID